MNQRVRFIVREFIRSAHAHGDVAAHHPTVAFDILSEQLQHNLLPSSGLRGFEFEGEVNGSSVHDIQFKHG